MNSRQQSIFFLLLLIVNMLQGQERLLRVSGTVRDEHNQPVSFASVTLKRSSDGKLMGGTTVDENGYFEVENLTEGNFQIQISVIGYKSYQRDISLARNSLDVGTIKLQEDALLLGEVAVTAKKDLVTRKMDRLVLNVNGNAAFAGKSSFDLFRIAPGVFVNNGNIAINGVWGTRIMVNGRPLNLSGEDLTNYLQNLKADDVEAVEVIAHPPAEYDAEGTGGMINIVLKKHAEEGLNGYLSADYNVGLGKYPSYLPSAKLNYRKGKLGMGIAYTYGRRKGFQEVLQNRKFLEEGDYTSSNYTINRSKNHSINFSTTYDIGKRQYIVFDYNGQYGQVNKFNQSYTNIRYPQIERSTSSTGLFPSRAKTDYTNLGLNYKIITDSLGSGLTVLTDYTFRWRDAMTGSDSKIFDNKNRVISDTLFNFNSPSNAKIFTADLQYDKKWSKNWGFTIGSKWAATDIDNTNAYDIFHEGTFEYNVKRFDYRYRERIAAGFVALSGNFLQMDFKIGIRGENSSIDGNIIGDGQDTVLNRDYFNLFPSLFLRRQLDQTGQHQVSLSYSRRITRPSYVELNPYRYFIDNYSVQTGNPLLNPQFTNALEIGYQWKKKYYIAFSYSRTKDVINQVIESSAGDSLMTILRKNTGESDVFMVNVNVPVNITKWWTTNNSLQLTRATSRAPEFDLMKYAFLFQTTQELALSDNFGVNINGFYTPNVLQGNIVTGRIAGLDVGIQKRFFNKKLLAKVAVSDIFYTNKFKATSYYNGTELNLWQKDQTRLLSISAMYNFSIGKAFKLKKVDKSNADERKRL